MSWRDPVQAGCAQYADQGPCGRTDLHHEHDGRRPAIEVVEVHGQVAAALDTAFMPFADIEVVAVVREAETSRTEFPWPGHSIKVEARLIEEAIRIEAQFLAEAAEIPARAREPNIDQAGPRRCIPEARHLVGVLRSMSHGRSPSSVAGGDFRFDLQVRQTSSLSTPTRHPCQQPARQNN